MISYLEHLKRVNNHADTKWVAKYDKKGLLNEIKQIYKPFEYYAMNKHKGENARPLHNKNAIIKIMELDKLKRNEQK
jgi:hypothetical protein|tara:strand:+ start:2207 stop:2437 length:231 start_codon:yes stop_codon:yes gene_type:complete